MKIKQSKANLFLILTVAAFILIRCFVSTPLYFIAMDEAKYLVLARNFPRHTLFNNQLYLVHPPLFPYLIHFFTLLFPDHTAGITVSFLCAIITLAALIGLLGLMGKDRSWITVALFIMVISPLHISTSRVVYKDSMFFGLFTLSLYFFIKGLIGSKRYHLTAAGLLGAATCLTSDLGLYLVAVFLVGYFIFRNPKIKLKDLGLTFAIMLLPYGSWLLVRFVAFRNNIYYPVGVDGTIEYVRDFNLRQLFTPRYFPATMTMFNFSADLSEFRINTNVYDLHPILKLPGFCPLIFYLFVGATGLMSLISGLAKRRCRNNPACFFSVLLIIFTLPVVLHPEPRFLIPILLPFCYLFAEGMERISTRITRHFRPMNKLAGATAAAAIILAGVHLSGARHLIFLLPKEVEAARSARYLKDLPGDGVMAQVGYPPELIYLSGKRVLALPVVSRVLDKFIRYYDIRYLLYGQHYLAPLQTDDPGLIWCYDTIKYIRENPRKYPLLKIVEERYQEAEQWPDLIFIHGVGKN